MEENKLNIAKNLLVGPLLDPADGVTPVTSLTLGGVTCKRWKGTTDLAITLVAAAPTGDQRVLAHEGDGYWRLETTTGDNDTLGDLMWSLQSSEFIPLDQVCQVVSANYFDHKYGAGNVNADVIEIEGADATDTLAAAAEVGADAAITAADLATAADVAAVAGFVHAGTAQAGAPAAITLDAGASDQDDFYRDHPIYITAGTGAGQLRYMDGYVGATRVATVNEAWDVEPDNTSEFIAGFGLSTRRVVQRMRGKVTWNASTKVLTIYAEDDSTVLYQLAQVEIDSVTEAIQPA